VAAVVVDGFVVFIILSDFFLLVESSVVGDERGMLVVVVVVAAAAAVVVVGLDTREVRLSVDPPGREFPGRVTREAVTEAESLLKESFGSFDLFFNDSIPVLLVVLAAVGVLPVFEKKSSRSRFTCCCSDAAEVVAVTDFAANVGGERPAGGGADLVVLVLVLVELLLFDNVPIDDPEGF